MLRSKSFDSIMRSVRVKKVREGERENDVEDNEVDKELRELDDRVKKWLQESCPPSRSTPTFTDDEFQLERKGRNTKIHAKRRNSMQETRERSQTCSTLGGESCTILYHPDFADWKSCETEHTASSSLDRNNSPIMFNLLDGAHTSISRLFSF